MQFRKCAEGGINGNILDIDMIPTKNDCIFFLFQTFEAMWMLQNFSIDQGKIPFDNPANIFALHVVVSPELIIFLIGM